MGIFQNLIGGGWKRLFKKKKGGHVVATGEFLILHEKSAIYYLFFMQILNDPTHTVRHYFDSRCSNRSGRFLLPRTNTNRYKASFLPSALSVFNENYNGH